MPRPDSFCVRPSVQHCDDANVVELRLKVMSKGGTFAIDWQPNATPNLVAAKLRELADMLERK